MLEFDNDAEAVVILIKYVYDSLPGFLTFDFKSVHFPNEITPIFCNDVRFFVSQSGKTADMILALWYCLECAALCVVVVNTVSSTISPETHCDIYINAGSEIAFVLSKSVFENDKSLRELVNSALATLTQLHATCLEGALKIMKTSYIHSEDVITGGLEHSSLALTDEDIALTDEDILIIIIMTRDSLYSKVQFAFEQLAYPSASAMNSLAPSPPFSRSVLMTTFKWNRLILSHSRRRA
ncbi:SIS domain-containing protein [Suillus weaverae]|nr:SIS domain-containing protein [Suillus weaverae]